MLQSTTQYRDTESLALEAFCGVLAMMGIRILRGEKRMPKALVPLADGFEEIEMTTIVDVLRRGGIHVTVAGLENRPHKGSRRIHIMPDVTLEEVTSDDFDIIILPGGKAGVEKLIAHGKTLELLREMQAANKTIAAICAAPLALRAAGVIHGSRLTSYPGLAEELPGADYSEERVVVDGKLITSRSPGTTMEFALKIVEIFMGKDKADNIARLMLVERV